MRIDVAKLPKVTVVREETETGGGGGSAQEGGWDTSRRKGTRDRKQGPNYTRAFKALKGKLLNSQSFSSRKWIKILSSDPEMT